MHHNEADGLAVQDNSHANISGCLVLGNLWSGIAVRDKGRVECTKNQVHTNGAAGIAMVGFSTGAVRRNCVSGHKSGDIQMISKAKIPPTMENNTHQPTREQLDRISAIQTGNGTGEISLTCWHALNRIAAGQPRELHDQVPSAVLQDHATRKAQTQRWHPRTRRAVSN